MRDKYYDNSRSWNIAAKMFRFKKLATLELTNWELAKWELDNWVLAKRK